jgi:hypothetical protein
MTYQITTQIEHVPTELGQQGYARLVMFANGQPIAHENFGCDHPTGEEVRHTRWSLAFHLYYNPLFEQYQNSLYRIAFPCA